MNKSEIFANELNLIQNEDLRNFTKYYLDNYVPTYFWEIGASSSGKYHPTFAQGEGGLVRHTKAVVMFAQELLRMNTYAYMNDMYKDYAIVACICHDTCKYGIENEMNKEQFAHHGTLAGDMMSVCYSAFFNGAEMPDLLYLAVVAHMGQWSQDARPFTPIDRLVHMADYMASRAFIDIPALHENTTKGENE